MRSYRIESGPSGLIISATSFITDPKVWYGLDHLRMIIVWGKSNNKMSLFWCQYGMLYVLVIIDKSDLLIESNMEMVVYFGAWSQVWSWRWLQVCDLLLIRIIKQDQRYPCLYIIGYYL